MMDKKRAKNVYAGYLGLYSFCGDQRRKKKVSVFPEAKSRLS